MTERVLFEYRAWRTQNGTYNVYKHGTEEYTFTSPSRCNPRPNPHFARRKKPFFTRRIRERSRRRIRQTLDFLENIYEDLYRE